MRKLLVKYPILNIVLISLAVALIISGAIAIFLPNYEKPYLGGNITELLAEKHIESVVGYEKNGNHFVKTEEDAYIVFKDFTDTIGSMSVTAKSDTQDLYQCKLYYAMPGQVFTEGNQIDNYIDQSERNIIYYDIPYNYYGYLRLDINAEEFELDDVSIGSQSLSYDKVGVSWKSFVIIYLISVITGGIWYRISKKNNWNKKQLLCHLILAAGCFGLFFLLQYMNVRATFFESDEGDNFLGGILINRGLHIYRDYISQHMPIMYYLCAVFAWLGAKTVFEFRICYYIFTAIMWTAMTLRYKKDYGICTMILYPIFFMCSIVSDGDAGTTILADQLQALGMAILLFEFLLYVKNRTVNIRNEICISFAIFCAFGSTFVAIFSIAVIVIYVMLAEIGVQIANKKRQLQDFVKRNGPLLVIVVSPFFVLFMVLLFQGILKDAYYGAFVVNTKFYSKYYPVGGSIRDTLINPIKWYLAEIKNPLPYVRIGIIATAIMGSIMILKKNFGAVIALYLCIVWAGTRGFEGFHSLAYHSMTMALLAIEIGMVREKIEKLLERRLDNSIDKFIAWGMAIVISFLVLICIGTKLWEKRGELRFDAKDDAPERNYSFAMIEKYAGEDGYVFTAGINTRLYMETNCIPAAVDPSCIWIYEAYHDKIFSDLETNKPQVAILPQGIVEWDYYLADFGYDIYDYVGKNFVSTDIENIYVRQK